MVKRKEDTFDFGFSTYSVDEITDDLRSDLESERAKSAAKEEELRTRLNDMYELVNPLLLRLRDTADREFLHWPNRKPIMQKMIDEMNALKS
jgi:hypothetical protein